jgi:sortase A
MIRGLEICTAVLVFFAGLFALLYPGLNGARLESSATQAAEDFVDAYFVPLEEVPTEMVRPYADLYAAMENYNLQIYEDKQNGLASYEAAGVELEAYGFEDGVAAVLSVPSIELSMPVYLGASYDNMAAGAAVMGSTSLPIGGENTNCVIAGHRGWNGAKYFLDIDKIQVGDTVQLTNLWETLSYTVVETKVIAPNDVEQIKIQDGRELLTLMSCHPYASGSKFRYLVICERVKT